MKKKRGKKSVKGMFVCVEGEKGKKTNGKAVHRLLEELVGLDLRHRRRLRALPLDEDLAELVRHLLQRQAQRKKHKRALVVLQGVTEGVHTAAGALQVQLVALHAEDHPRPVGGVGESLVVDRVRDAHRQ